MNLEKVAMKLKQAFSVTGSAIGAGVGALGGLATGDKNSNKFKRMLVGGAIGAGVGGGVPSLAAKFRPPGSMTSQELKELSKHMGVDVRTLKTVKDFNASNRAVVKKIHPDKGGSNEVMASYNALVHKYKNSPQFKKLGAAVARIRMKSHPGN
jgi:hypothetical protein